jgi:O-antigen ligase
VAFWLIFIWCMALPVMGLLPIGLQDPLKLLLGPSLLIVAFVSTGGVNRRIRSSIAIAFGYLGWMGLSIFWTQAHSRRFAVCLYISFCCECLAAILIGRYKKNLLLCIRGTIAASLVLAVVLLVNITINPTIVAESHMFARGAETGIDANFLGFRIALGMIAALVLALRKMRQMWPITGFLFFAVIASTSKSSILLTVILGGLHILRNKGVRAIKVLLPGMTVGALALPLGWTYFQAWLAGEASTNLTGRLPLWAQVFDQIPERLVIGHGFLSFQDSVDTAWHAMHSHNDYLQQLFTLGCIGFCLWMSFYIVLYRQLRKSAHPLATVGLLWVQFAAIRGLVDSDLLYTNLPLPLALILFVSCPPARKRVRRRVLRPAGPTLLSDSPEVEGGVAN